MGAKDVAGHTRLDTLHQRGSLKALFPRGTRKDLHTVFVNTAGGITGGDAFTFDLTAREASRLSVSSQAAERAYRAQPGTTGTVQLTASVAADARLDWLPQETILFEGASLRRRISVHLAPTASFFCVEPIVFGRTAMGETVTRLAFTDQWRIYRDDTLIFADALRLDGNATRILDHAATTNGHIAIATLLLVALDAERYLVPIRKLLPETAGASLIRDGVLAARLTAPDSFDLRRTLVPAIETLSDAPLPKVWSL